MKTESGYMETVAIAEVGVKENTENGTVRYGSRQEAGVLEAGSSGFETQLQNYPVRDFMQGPCEPQCSHL